MELTEFADNWLAHSTLRPPPSAYDRAGENVGTILYRDPPFQVQMWTLPPNSIVTEHAHPCTDTLLVRVAGKLRLRVNGRWMPLNETERTEWLGMRTWRYRVRPGEMHEVAVGTPGACFLAISKQSGDLVSVHQDWVGPALDAAHAGELEDR